MWVFFNTLVISAANNLLRGKERENQVLISDKMPSFPSLLVGPEASTVTLDNADHIIGKPARAHVPDCSS